MSRIRSIKPQFFLNDELASLNPLDRLLFIGLWTIADREGRLEDRPVKIKAALLPYDAHDVDAALKRLAGGGFIERYSFEDGGKRYVQIKSFGKHQCPNSKEPQSAIPAPCRDSAAALPGTAPAPCRDGSGTPRLGKGKEGKGESVYSRPPEPKPPLPITRPGQPEKAGHPGKFISPNGPENSGVRPARAGPAAEERGKYDGIAENI